MRKPSKIWAPHFLIHLSPIVGCNEPPAKHQSKNTRGAVFCKRTHIFCRFTMLTNALDAISLIWLCSNRLQQQHNQHCTRAIRQCTGFSMAVASPMAQWRGHAWLKSWVCACLVSSGHVTTAICQQWPRLYTLFNGHNMAINFFRARIMTHVTESSF